jgi:GTP-binding protein
MRASGRDENVIITPHRVMGLEEGIEWIDDDELVEVTPKSIRLRKRVLPQNQRPSKRKADADD